MTMPRRPLRRGRTLALAGALVMLVAALLPWYAFDGDLPGGTFRGWEGSGILVLGAGLAVVAIATLRWAAREEPELAVRADRWPAYALVAGVALVGVLAWPIAFVDAPAGLAPTRAPGWWLAVAGVVLVAVAARRIARERARS